MNGFPTEEDLQALVSAALDDGKSYGEIIKLLRAEDQCLGLRDAASYCKVVLGRLRDKGDHRAHLMLENVRSI